MDRTERGKRMGKKVAEMDAPPVHRTTTRSSEGAFEPFHIDDVPWQRLPGPTTCKRLGRFGGGSQVGVGIDLLKPGQTSNRFHFHMKEDEHVFILKGSATLRLGESGYVMVERRYCCFPAGQRASHHLYNHTGENCVFRTIGNNRPEVIVCFPKTGRARVRITGTMVPISEV
jgi:uncharacterized cupin superfamily protein